MAYKLSSGPFIKSKVPGPPNMAHRRPSGLRNNTVSPFHANLKCFLSIEKEEIKKRKEKREKTCYINGREMFGGFYSKSDKANEPSCES